MRKSLGFGLTAAAVIGTVLTPTAGWAAVTSAPAQAPATAKAPATATAPAGALVTSTTAPAGADPNTTVTFTVTTSGVSMTAPTTVNLGSGAPGATISGPLGSTEVIDARAALGESWTATASAITWTTGGGTPAEQIPAGDVGYSPGAIATTGTITATGTSITLSGTATPVVTGTSGVGDNTATWDPTLSVAVPAGAVGGLYTGTLIQSVS